MKFSRGAIIVGLLLITGIARATITVTGTNNYASNNAVNNFALNLPASLSAGDLLLMQANYDNASAALTTPVGWTLLRNDTNGSDRQTIFYRYAASSDVAGSATTWSFSVNTDVAAIMLGMRSDIGQTVIVNNQRVDSGTGTALTGNSFSASTPGMLLRIYGIAAGNATFTLPGALSQVAVSSTSNALGDSLIIANRSLASSGATGANTATSSTSANWITQSLALGESLRVDHFEISHDGQGLTCEPENIAIRACANDTCSVLISTPVTVTLNPSSGWVGGNTHTFTGSATLQFGRNTAGTAAISVASSAPAVKPASINKCNGTNSNTCNLPFVNAGLVFDVPNVLANKPSGAVRLRAVQNSGDVNNSCVALFQNTTQTINFWSTYTNPTTGAQSIQLRPIAGSFNPISNNSNSPTAINLAFDNNGESAFEIRYADAGSMTLKARYNGSGTYNGLVLNGSDGFVSTPAGFCIRGAAASTPTSYVTCTNLATCTPIAKAGRAFTLNIAAVGWESDTDSDFCSGNISTPNYRQSALALSSQFNAGTSGVNGSVTPATVTINSNGTVTQNNVTESEVGIFTFTVTPPSSAYFGLTVPATTSAPIGRFTPDHFSVSNGTLINRAASNCATAPAFTYLGETLNLNYQLKALNASNAVTQNYQNGFAKLTTFAQLNTKALVPSPRATLTLISSPSGSNLFNLNWINGQSDVVSPVSVVYQAQPITILKGTAPIGPYSNTAFSIAPTDADNIVATGFNLDTDIPADGKSDHVKIGNSTELRYGRLRLNSVSGPSDMDLPIPIAAEYWNGNSFVISEPTINPPRLGDSCTVINGFKATYTPALGATGPKNTGPTTLNNGQSSTALIMQAPGAGIYGNVSVSIDLTNAFNLFPWLQFDWNGDGTLDATTNATASFGTYRGSDRVIFWQEIK